MVVPTPGGARNPLVLAAAHLAGVTRAFAIGGAQAIAALAYGTATIPAVDKICGPGNAYVAAAKRRVFGAVGIDMIAGASEVLVIADGSANPDWVAMDLFAQAEHDELAQAILVTPDAALHRRGRGERAAADRGACRGARSSRASLANRGALIKVRDLDEACAVANRVAPEHLELAVAEPARLLPKIRHAGAIFMGHHASEALGDYCAGPNHVLPTGRTARFSSPLGVYDFQKRSSVLDISVAAARALGPVAATLADGEGLRRTRKARGTACERGLIDAAHPSDFVAAIVRPEIRALSAYAVAHADGHDQARRDGESVSRCRRRCGRRSPPRSPTVPVNRYPDGGADAVKAALREAFGIPESLGVILGNGSDELIQIVTVARRAARRRDARARAVVRDVPDERALRRHALRRRPARAPTSRSTPTRWSKRSSASGLRSSFSRIRTIRREICSHRGRHRAHPARRAGARRRRRGVSRVRGRELPAARSPSSRTSSSLRTVSKIGMAGLRLGYAVAAPEWIDGIEQGAPAV